MVTKLFQAVLILMLLLNPAFSLAAQLEAVPDRSRVGLEESFTLELRSNSSLDGSPDLSVLEEDFEILGRSQASQIQIINGDLSRTTTWTLSLLARSAGSKMIPSLCVEDVCSPPVAIEVLPAGQGGSATSSGNDLLLEVSAEPARVWVQAQLLYKVRLLTRLNFLQASLTEPQPTGIETVVQKLGEDRNYETERDGLRYRVVERVYAFFPQQSGQLTIPPVRFGAQVADGSRGGFDPFGQHTRQLRKSSEALNIEVLPSPELQGRNWLPASKVQLTDDWQQKPPRLTVGEPVTRTITLRAEGLPAAQIPVLTVDIPEGVKSYPDQPNREDQVGAQGVTGTLQQKLALVPTQAGRLTLPEVKIDWWDLKNQRWQQARLAELELEIIPAAGQPAVTAAPPALQNEQTTAVPEPQPAASDNQQQSTKSFWPWLSLTLACGWLLTLYFLIKGKRERPGLQKQPVQAERTSTLKSCQKALHGAIRSGEPIEIRAALLAWGKTLFPGQQPGNLEQLAKLCGEPLAGQLESFSRSLYSRSSQDWDPQALLSAVQQKEKQVNDASASEQLPPFYPQ